MSLSWLSIISSWKPMVQPARYVEELAATHPMLLALVIFVGAVTLNHRFFTHPERLECWKILRKILEVLSVICMYVIIYIYMCVYNCIYIYIYIVCATRICCTNFWRYWCVLHGSSVRRRLNLECWNVFCNGQHSGKDGIMEFVTWTHFEIFHLETCGTCCMSSYIVSTCFYSQKHREHNFRLSG